MRFSLEFWYHRLPAENFKDLCTLCGIDDKAIKEIMDELEYRALPHILDSNEFD